MSSFAPQALPLPAAPWLSAYIVPESIDYRPELTAEEARIIEDSTSPRRITEFAAGRKAAHEAIRIINPGMADRAVLKHESGAPIGDPAVRLSIAHTKGAACAIAGLEQYCRAVAIDIEVQSRPLSNDTIKRFATETEQRWILSGRFSTQEAGLRVFSAKECGFKLLTPLGCAPKTVTGISVIWNDTAAGFQIEGAENEGLIRSTAFDTYLISWIAAPNLAG